MKSIIIVFIAALLCSYSAIAQQNEVPSIVKTTFSNKYPNASKVKWEKEEGKYEASFSQNGKEMSVLFSENGAIEETETEIKVSELPGKAKSYAMLKGKIKEASKIVASNGTIKYEAEVQGKDLIFDAQGNFLEEKTEKDEDED